MRKSFSLRIIILLSASIQAIHASLTTIENEEQFNKIIQSHTPSIVVFSADWCGACVSFKNVLDKVADNPQFSYITFAKVNIDTQKELVQKQHIESIPAIRFFQNNIAKHSMSGSQSEQTFITEITKIFPVSATPATIPSESIHEAEAITTHEPETTPEAMKSQSLETTTAAQPVETVPQPQEETSTSFMGMLQNLFGAFICSLMYLKDMIVSLFIYIKNLFTSNS